VVSVSLIATQAIIVGQPGGLLAMA